MTNFKRSLGLAVSSFAVFLSIVVPAIASAQTYPYGYSNSYATNCNWYATTNGYPTNGYYNPGCVNNYGTLLVYVRALNNDNYGNNYSGYLYRDPSFFSVYVTGASASQQQFQGSLSGTSVRLVGAYSVAVTNPDGYTPSYSVGCSGTVASGGSETCIITMAPTAVAYPNTYYNYNYNTQPYSYVAPVVAQPAVVYAATYVPSLPNTGFKPFDTITAVLSLVLLVVASVLALPYVRKSITAIVG